MALILVVDDSWLTRKIVGKILTSGGYDVEEAVNGTEAVEAAEGGRPDCLLLDLLMPELDGFGVLEILREKELAIPVVVLSADIQQTSLARCLELGARTVINKPPKDQELLEAIRAALESTGNPNR